MAVDMFIKIEGIKGEATQKGFEGQIDVLSWSWGMSQQGHSHLGSGGGAGKVNMQDISLTKYVDKASPTLVLKCCKGDHIPSALLTVRKAGGKQLEYLKIAFKDLLVTSVQHSGASGGDDRLTEALSLNFSEFEIIYTPQKADGSGDAAITTKFNLKQGVGG